MTDRATLPGPAGPAVRSGDAGLELTGVRKRYGSVLALDGVDLSVPTGRVTALLGENGAGKSTLMSIVAGLRRADAGSVRVAGHDPVTAPHAARLALGLAAQEPAIYPPLTARQNMLFHAELAGLRRSAARTRVDEIADPLALTGLLDRRAGQLSGGQQRRLHVALALLHRPRVLLLDEPTAGVDVQTRTGLLDLVRTLAREGTAVCYSTHYLTEVETLGAHVAVLDAGRIIAHDTLTELVRRHGRSALDLTFRGPPPDLDLPWPVTRTAHGLRIGVEAPHRAAAELLQRLGPAAAEQLTGLRIVRPSLESVFVELTGRSFAAGAPPVGATEPPGKEQGRA